jgi:hypothetical protein
MIAAFGEGGLGNRNIMQLTHCCFNLQRCYPNIFKELWRLINDGENLDSLTKKAVLTRWWYVTCAMGNLIKNWDAWLEVATQLVNLEGGSKKAGKIASSLFSLMQEPVLKCHALFVVAFSTSFFHKHYEWMQRSDDIAKVNGYRARSTAEHFFITITELDEMAA